MDAAKAVGLFLVVLGHMVALLSPTSKFIFSFHIPLFFFLSGYVYKDNTAHFGVFFKKYFRLLIVPYFLYSLVGTGIGLLFWPANITWRNIVKELLYLVKPDFIFMGQLWFLVALFISLCLFYIWRQLQAGKPVYIKLLLFLITIFMAIGVTQLGFRLPLKLDSAFMAVLFVAAGFESKNRYILDTLLKYKWQVIILAPCIVYLFGIRLNGYVNLSAAVYGNPFYYFIAAFSGIALTIVIADYLQSFKFLQYYGRNTLIMFSFHSFYLYFVAAVLYLVTGTFYTWMVNVPTIYSLIMAIIVFVALYPLGRLTNK